MFTDFQWITYHLDEVGYPDKWLWTGRSGFSGNGFFCNLPVPKPPGPEGVTGNETLQAVRRSFGSARLLKCGSLPYWNGPIRKPKPRHGTNPVCAETNKMDSTTEPMVIGWMPAASLYFRDPDENLLELLSMLPDSPQPDLGVVSWSRWNQIRESVQGQPMA
jgi:hypothetical protein